MSDETDNAITLSQLLAASPMRVTVAGTARLQTEAARLCDELESATNEIDRLRAENAGVYEEGVSRLIEAQKINNKEIETLRAALAESERTVETLRDILASLDGIATVTPKYWEMPRDMFADEFLPWAQSRARDSAGKLRAILATKEGRSNG